MPAPKNLEQHVRSVTFRARRHRHLLEDAPALPWPQLAVLQGAYRATQHELERRALAVEFERAVRQLGDDDDEREAREQEQRELDELLGQVDEFDPDADAAEADRAHRAIWARDLRRSGLSYRAIGEQIGATASQVRRMLFRLERELAPLLTGRRAAGAAEEEDPGAASADRSAYVSHPRQ